jgi:hypothetical protein
MKTEASSSPRCRPGSVSALQERTYSCATVIRNVCLAVPITSGLAQYLIARYVHHIDVDDIENNRKRWKTIPSDFLTKTLIVILRRVKDDGEEHNPNDCWCEYYEHASESSEKECWAMEGREDDLDMEYKVARLRRPFRWFGGCC